MRKVPLWVGKTDDTRPPPRVLRRIFERENGVCHISGRKIAPGEVWQADHKIALINGGRNSEDNLFPALGDPHKEKTRADLAEKKRVSALALSHIGASRPQSAFPSRGFAEPAPKDRTLTKQANGVSAIRRLYVNAEDQP